MVDLIRPSPKCPEVVLDESVLYFTHTRNENTDLLNEKIRKYKFRTKQFFVDLLKTDIRRTN